MGLRSVLHETLFSLYGGKRTSSELPVTYPPRDQNVLFIFTADPKFVPSKHW